MLDVIAGIDELRVAIAAVVELPADEIDLDADLIALGMDSIRIMKLASSWRVAGVDVKYRDLFAEPTLRAWQRMLARGGGATATDRARSMARQPIAPPQDAGDRSFRLTPVQEAYWVGRQPGAPLGGVGSHYYVELDGEGVEPGALELAVQSLIGRHPMLRARFTGDGHQEILDPPPPSRLTVHDLRHAEPDEVAASLQELRRRLMHRALDVAAGHVLDVQLSLLPEGRTRVHLEIDMLVADAVSFRMLLDDLAQLYEDPFVPAVPTALDFPEYVQRLAAAREIAIDREEARRYWEHCVDSLPGPPALPLARDPAGLTGHGFIRRHALLEGPLVQRLDEQARSRCVTPSAAFATAFVETLAAWSSEPCFLMSVPAFEREPLHADVDRIVGDFTQLVVVAVDLSERCSFADRVSDIQRRMHEALANGAYSGVELLRRLSWRRGGAIASPVVFTSAIGMGDLFSAAVRSTLGAPGWSSAQTPQVWLDCQVTERDGGLLLNWDVVDGIFQPGVVDAMFAAFERIVRAMARDAFWQAPVGDLRPEGQKAVRRRANSVVRALPRARLHEAFLEHARRAPAAPALVTDAGDVIDYGELALRARRAARVLVEAGVRPGDTVAVTLPRSVEQVVAVLGTLVAGATYVPVGIDQPTPRAEQMYRTSATQVVVTTDEAAHDGAARNATPLRVALDDRVPPLEDVARGSPGDPAYVIFTSGSTGEPKAVEITHEAALNTVQAVNEWYGVTATDRGLAVSSLDFDLSVYDIFGLLSAGGSLVLLDDCSRSDARRWAELTASSGVTIWNSVPSALDMLLTVAKQEELRTIRLALVSGDRIGRELPLRFRQLTTAARFVALGGATEASIWSNHFEVTDVAPTGASIPYGRPLANQRFRAVDARGGDCPDWVAGELWIGGAGVARGYRGDPALTASRFVEYDGGRWYRTGDVGRYQPDGTLEFIGRRDRRVKVRGHRLELGEVEATLAAHEAVEVCAVVMIDGPVPRLGAAVTACRSGQGVVAELDRFLRERLPAHAIPSRYAILPALPLTPNGKIDRKAVEREFMSERTRAVTAGQDRSVPSGPIEEQLAELWRSLLGVPVRSTTESFFDLGGDSVAATRLIDATEQRFGVVLTLRDLLEAPTIGALAARVGGDAAMPEEGVV